MAKTMHIKRNDVVVILTGRDRGKQGAVLSVLPKKNLVLVKGIAIVTKHVKARKQGDVAGIRKEESYIHASNVKRIEK